jgi:hypothetical protein
MWLSSQQPGADFLSSYWKPRLAISFRLAALSGWTTATTEVTSGNVKKLQSIHWLLPARSLCPNIFERSIPVFPIQLPIMAVRQLSGMSLQLRFCRQSLRPDLVLWQAGSCLLPVSLA